MIISNPRDYDADLVREVQTLTFTTIIRTVKKCQCTKVIKETQQYLYDNASGFNRTSFQSQVGQ